MFEFRLHEDQTIQNTGYLVEMATRYLEFGAAYRDYVDLMWDTIYNAQLIQGEKYYVLKLYDAERVRILEMKHYMSLDDAISVLFAQNTKHIIDLKTREIMVFNGNYS